MVSSFTLLRDLSSALVTGFKTLKNRLAPLKFPVATTNTKRAYCSVMRRGARAQHRSCGASDEGTTLGSPATMTLELPKHSIANSDTAVQTRLPLPNCTLHTCPNVEPDFGGEQDHDTKCAQKYESGLLEKLHMALLDLVDEYGIFDLNQLALNAQAPLGTIVHVEAVVESVEDDSNSNDGKDKGGGEDSGDNVPLEAVKHDLQRQQQRLIEIQIVPEDRLIGSPSYRIFPRHDGYRNDVQRRSDNIQMHARLHAVQQLKRQSVKQDEHPEPTGQSRPSVLSGLGRSSPLRNSWTLDDI